ncbi:MAG: glutamine-hydrolyzing carbamoyl-phosphate synthase small subunit [Roseibium sp.]|uniref:glutamine-hydrolyzing carbamoyl-phosphate synthase small subunit n=1 Tax=Roseibium sp. TaxID=1936156 RepID=UPI003D9C3D51
MSNHANNLLNILVRQPLTQSSELEASVISQCLSEIKRIDGHFANISLLGSSEAQSNESFRETFEQNIGAPFTPRNFRNYRLSLMRNADAFINIRTAMSESTAFEVAYNIFGGENVPMLFAVWRNAPIKTTLIRDLEDLGHVTYVEFDKPRDLRRPLWTFLELAARQKFTRTSEALLDRVQEPEKKTYAGATPKAPCRHTALLALADGTLFYGKGIGREGVVSAELCFNTAMTGYQEILSDPSYAGQVVTFSFPHIGNVGVNRHDDEAQVPLARGCVLRDEITAPSNHRSETHFEKWLCDHGLTGICGIDTRALTRHLRENGAQNCAISFDREARHDPSGLVTLAANQPSLVSQKLVEGASTKSVRTVQSQGEKDMEKTQPHVALIDYGVKGNIVDCLTRRGCRVSVVPATVSSKEVMKLAPDGILLSNGPGDPVAVAPYTVPTIRSLTRNGLPIFGICLGHQLLALALGGKVSKMHFGHHGANHPVYDKHSDKVLITSQNHGFVVDRDSLPKETVTTHVSLFDGTLAGFELPKQQILSVQFHPEASPGPHDAAYLFDDFVERARTVMHEETGNNPETLSVPDVQAMSA